MADGFDGSDRRVEGMGRLGDDVPDRTTRGARPGWPGGPRRRRPCAWPPTSPGGSARLGRPVRVDPLGPDGRAGRHRRSPPGRPGQLRRVLPPDAGPPTDGSPSPWPVRPTGSSCRPSSSCRPRCPTAAWSTPRSRRGPPRGRRAPRTGPSSSAFPWPSWASVGRHLTGATGPARRRSRAPSPGSAPGGSGPAPPVASMAGLVVADLSALWAGPLVGRLLARAGARVIKVESTSRLDGARRRRSGVLRGDERGQGLGGPRLRRGRPGGELLARHRVPGRRGDHRRRGPGPSTSSASTPRPWSRDDRPRVWLMISGLRERGVVGRPGGVRRRRRRGRRPGGLGRAHALLLRRRRRRPADRPGRHGRRPRRPRERRGVGHRGVHGRHRRGDDRAGPSGRRAPAAAPPGPATAPPASSVRALGEDTAAVLAELGIA